MLILPVHREARGLASDKDVGYNYEEWKVTEELSVEEQGEPV